MSNFSYEANEMHAGAMEATERDEVLAALHDFGPDMTDENMEEFYHQFDNEARVGRCEDAPCCGCC